MRIRDRKGQSTVEYAIVIAVIIAALIAMNVYMKRGTMGKLRDATDQIGDQFSPSLMQSNFVRRTNSGRNEISSANGLSETFNQVTSQSRTGSENLMTNVAGDNAENLIY